MKTLLTFIICLYALVANAQEKNNTFHVVDSLSGKAVPSVSVTIIRAKLAITTENDGIFIIPGDLAKMRDTIIIYAQSYHELRIPIHKLSTMDTIRFPKFTSSTIAEKVNYKKESLLNDYNSKDVVHYAGLNTETANFDYLQIAQKFETPQAGIKLKDITLNRLGFGVFDSDRTFMGVEHIDPVTFRIRIYDINPVTGGPGKDLYNEIIEKKINAGKQINIDLKKLNIIIPHKTFFIAIEWMRDYFNMGYSVIYDFKTNKEKRTINYRPAIGIAAVTSDKLNIWVLNFKYEWKPFTYFMPFGTDLAIKATVEY